MAWSLLDRREKEVRVVGKPNLPADADDRPDVKGSATPTPGLTAIDQEREASMADEGGASGMTVETEEPLEEEPVEKKPVEKEKEEKKP